MGLRGKLSKLEKAMRGNLDSFELVDGTRFYIDPREAMKISFLYWGNCMRADWKREPRPEPPDLFRAVANAKDRGEALSRAMGGSSFLALDREALVERGEFVHRSLLAGHEYGEDGVLRPTTENDEH